MQHLENIRDLVYEGCHQEALQLARGRLGLAYVGWHQGRVWSSAGIATGPPDGFGSGEGNADGWGEGSGGGNGWGNGGGCGGGARCGWHSAGSAGAALPSGLGEAMCQTGWES